MSTPPKDTKTGKDVKLTNETYVFLNKCGFNDINETKIISLNNIYTYTSLLRGNTGAGSDLPSTQSNTMPQPPLYWALMILAQAEEDKRNYTLQLPHLIEAMTARIDYMRNIIINLIKAGADVNYHWTYIDKTVVHDQAAIPAGQIHLMIASRGRTIHCNILEEFINKKELAFFESEILSLFLQSNFDSNQTVTLKEGNIFSLYATPKMLPCLEILAEMPNLNCVNYELQQREDLEWNLHGLQHKERVNQLHELLTLRKHCQQALLPILASDTPLMKLLRMGDLNQIEATLKKGTEKDGTPMDFNTKNEKGETLTKLLHKVFPSVFFDNQGKLKLLGKGEFDKLNSAEKRLYPLVETIVTRNAKSVEHAATTLAEPISVRDVLGLIGEHMDPDQISDAKTFFDPKTGKEKADKATAAMLKMRSPMPTPKQSLPPKPKTPPKGHTAAKPVVFHPKPTTGSGSVASRIRDIEKRREEEKAKAKKPPDKKHKK